MNLLLIALLLGGGYLWWRSSQSAPPAPSPSPLPPGPLPLPAPAGPVAPAAPSLQVTTPVGWVVFFDKTGLSAGPQSTPGMIQTSKILADGSMAQRIDLGRGVILYYDGVAHGIVQLPEDIPLVQGLTAGSKVTAIAG